MRPESLVGTPRVCHAGAIQDEAEMRNYRAFISYNHGDERIARKLHRRIEAYRPSKRLKPTPRRLSPVFRDRDEMAAATDLPDKVTMALQNSENLVVLCSPRAAASEWVNREVATFADMHGPDRIFPVIVEGEAPGCFPPSLLDATPNPLAADLQDDKDGFADGALKLIAALLPAPYGEVKNREAARARRRARINGGLAGVFAILLVAAVVFGFRAVEETRRANAELTRAEAAILTLVQGIEEIVDQVAAGAETGAITTGVAAALLSTAEGMAERAIAQAPDNPRLNEEYAYLLIALARHHERAGDTEKAAVAAAKASAVSKIAERAGGSAVFLRALALEKQGDSAMTRGDLDAALRYYRDYEALMRATVGERPNSTTAIRNVSVSLERIGDVRAAQGDLTGALAVYEEGLAIARYLAVRDPGNAKWARNVSGSLERIGNVRVVQGDLTGALAVYEEGLAINRDLAARDPGNAESARNMSVSLNKVGDVRVAQGELNGALAVYEEGLALRRDLTARDPGNAGWARDVSFSLNKVGDVRVAQGELTGALAVYEEGLALARDLVARDPENAGWAHDVSISLERVGDVRAAQGDVPGSLAAYEEGLMLRRKLAAQDPGNAEWARNVVVSCAKLAQANPSEAARYWSEAVEIVEALDARGALAPVDRWMLDDTKAQLAAALAD